MQDNMNEEMLIIIENFTPKIKQCLHQTSYQDREDLEQEIKLKIIEKLTTKELENTPSFWNFFV